MAQEDFNLGNNLIENEKCELENKFFLDDCIKGSISLFLEKYISKNQKYTELSILIANYNTYFYNRIYKSLYEKMKLDKRKSLDFLSSYELFS